MTDERSKNIHWRIVRNSDGYVDTWDQVHAAILMDIRDELQELNHLLRCPNFIAIPRKLDAIRKNTAKPREEKNAK
jgi:hypothetical protein